MAPNDRTSPPPMTLRALRELAGKTKGDIAEALDILEDGVDDLENVEAEDELSLADLRWYVAAFGATCEVVVTLPDGRGITLAGPAPKLKGSDNA